MKHLIFAFCLLLPWLGQAQSETDSNAMRIYRLDLNGDLDASKWSLTKKAFLRAKQAEADHLLVRLNTNGGESDFADSIRTRFLRSDLPVSVMIDNNAAGAGCMIAIAAENIFMSPDATFGPAWLPDEENDKTPASRLTYLRSKMRSTAEVRGRNIKIAEAMIDPEVDFPPLAGKGKILVYTAKQGKQSGYVSEIYPNAEAVANALSDNNFIWAGENGRPLPTVTQAIEGEEGEVEGGFYNVEYAQQQLRDLAGKKAKVFVYDINDGIGGPSFRRTQSAMKQASEYGADIILLRLNTYGGRVDHADSIRTRFLRSPIPMLVLIENNAASAGALISIACDKIFMQPGSTIGAATVVTGQGEAAPDKYQSYFRSKMRATAELNGRDPDIAEAMVDQDLEVPGISEKGKLITFSTNDAVKYGYCDGVANNVEEALKLAGIEDYEIKNYETSTLEALIQFLLNDQLQGILILVIIGGIYFELQSPGIGFPLIASIIAATLFFAPSYLEHVASTWEIALFVIGIGLLAVEIFAIPGFGVAGISGIALMMAGLTLSMIDNDGFDFTWVPTNDLVRSLLIVLIASMVSIIGSIYLASRLLKTAMLSNLVLNSSQKKDEGYVGTSTNEFVLVGKEGEAVTDLRPSGSVEIEGELYDATAESGYLVAGTKIKVVDYEAAQIMVREIEG